jgi:hypothetical protein
MDLKINLPNWYKSIYIGWNQWVLLKDKKNLLSLVEISLVSLGKSTKNDVLIEIMFIDWFKISKSNKNFI